jgi:hypothetical protein
MLDDFMELPGRAKRAAEGKAPAGLDRGRELLALIRLEHGVDTRERVEARFAQLAQHLVVAHEQLAEEILVEGLGAQTGGQIAAGAVALAPLVARSSAQFVDGLADLALLIAAEVEAVEQPVGVATTTMTATVAAAASSGVVSVAAGDLDQAEQTDGSDDDSEHGLLLV